MLDLENIFLKISGDKMARLTRLKITNFKSIGEIDTQLDHLNIIVGMNGAGKSSFLQALEFTQAVLNSDVQNFLSLKEWNINDLDCSLLKESNIEIAVELNLDEDTHFLWEATFNRRKLNCTFERLSLNGKAIIDVKNNRINLLRSHIPAELFVEYTGSILGIVKLHSRFEEAKSVDQFTSFFKSIINLGMIDTNSIKKDNITHENYIGPDKNLVNYINQLSIEKKFQLLQTLQKFYPQLIEINVSNLRTGFNKLSIIEQFGDTKFSTNAQHINDGLLRILTILTYSNSNPNLLIIDEVDNGINQELIELLVNFLTTSKSQIILTTHNPLVLNFLDDDLAIKSVKFIYKNKNGFSKINNFFEIPRIKNKLNMMGAGDALLDTDLIQLAQECNY